MINRLYTCLWLDEYVDIQMKQKLFLLLALSFCLPSQTYGALLELTQAPLFLRSNVPPNVIFSLDDAGSMDWEFLADQYWEQCAYDPNTTGTFSALTTCGSIINNGGIFYGYNPTVNDFQYFSYYFTNTDNAYNTTCNKNNDQSSIQNCNNANSLDWRAFSSHLNTIYYNPSVAYKPWKGPCLSNGTECANASFTSARSMPADTLPGYSLTRNLADSKYEVWIDDRGYSGSRPLRGTLVNATSTSNNQIDFWDSHITVVLGANDVKVYKTTYTPNTLGIGTNTTLEATLTDTNACYNVLGTTALVTQVFRGNLSYTSINSPGCSSITLAKQNYANWYQYQRKRSYAARAAVSTVVNAYPTFRFGLNMSHQVNPFLVEVPPLPPVNYSSHNQALLRRIFTYPWQPQPSKLREGLHNVGQYYMNKLAQANTNPITESCQQNYAILVTDGYWNDNFNPNIYRDVDRDGIPLTLADVARYYYITDLSSLPNRVAPNAWDNATWQHMVTYTVGFGVRGKLVAGSDGWPTPSLTESSNWGNPFTDKAAQIDDLWHAAFNSKGSFIQAQNPTALESAFNAFLANIAVRNASATSVAQNSSVLNTESQVYQAVFSSENWQGDLLAYPISLQGVLSTTPAWNANCVLTGGACSMPTGTNAGISPDNRVILTRNWNGENRGIAFRWPSNYSSYKVSGVLPTNMANFLNNAPFPANTSDSSQISVNQAYGNALLRYLRGDRTNEIQNNGQYLFRNRETLLGDIVNSSPLYVGAPNRIYLDTFEASAYSTFKSTNATRKPIIYVGANDGMLHGFDASNGREVLAYIPGDRQIYNRLSSLSQTNYPHYFFVDGSPQESDVYFNSAWHTILVGTLNNGGQSIYALNITNPSNFTETNANSIYLWEFSDKDDPDMGYVQGQVTIGKVKSALGNRWAVIFGNGYNNSQSDGYASTTGKAALYVIFIDAGIGGTWTANTSYIKIPVGTGSVTTPNALSQPYAVDVDGDFIIDYVYAGDLQGNVWKFDLRNGTPTNWAANTTKLFQAYQTTAGDQSITAPVIVGPGPTGIANGVMVYFGTGKFIEPSDNSAINQTTQSFYGIWDKLNGATVLKTSLVGQEILAELQPPESTSTFRVVTNNAVNYGTPNQKLGWFLNLIVQGSSTNKGERQISKPLLRNGNVVFTTLLPSLDVCEFGGQSWLMEISALTGGTPKFTPFDINNDGVFTSEDSLQILVNNVSHRVFVSGVKSTVGITSTPSIFLSPDKKEETKVLSGSTGLGTVKENTGIELGRQNWRQIY